ncbi:hypothetical protein NRB56_76420 [Nocardia sp. RB56]|uniref:Uncharacterized protein n=1 Tax=Nocardia aurantia TaxID=2585199 RepID=A0A7K0E2J1_9NOCA|nr:hypothetical protein [Nocardia aurantia]
MTDHHHRLRDPGLPQQGGLDLAEFDPQAAQFHLEVGAAQVVQFAGGGPRHQVAGAVHPLTGLPERIGHEPVRGQVRAAEVSARQLRTGEIQLTGHARRHRVQPRVEDVHPGVPHRPADRHGDRIRVHHFVIGDVDGGLGGAVQVVQTGAGQRTQPLGGGGGQRLAGGEDLPQAAGGRLRRCRVQRRHEHRQHRGHEMRCGDAVFGDDPGQVHRIPVPVRARDHQSRAGLQGPEQLPHRHVEGGGGLLEHHVGAGERVLVLHPQQAVHDRRMGDGHALRPAGRPRRENHVGGVDGQQRPAPFRVGERSVGISAQVQRVDLQDRKVVAGDEVVAAGGEDRRRPRGVQHVVDAVGGLVGVERHVTATGLQRRVHRDQQVQ